LEEALKVIAHISGTTAIGATRSLPKGIKFDCFAPKAVLHSAATALPLSTRLGHWRPFLL
jgi:hypothetical protein